MNEDELLYLLKHGRADDIRFIFKDIEEKSYPEDFPTFIDTMIREHKIKRKNIAIRSGMSQDYTYKLLRGDKKTTERDYILAICIAIGMNLAQVQHALRIYGMPVLSKADLRSHIISLGISEGKDIDEINDWLEKSGFYLIRTSPDMPSAPIKSLEAVPIEAHAEYAGSYPEGSSSSDEDIDDIDDYEEADIQIHAERCGQPAACAFSADHDLIRPDAEFTGMVFQPYKRGITVLKPGRIRMLPGSRIMIPNLRR